MPRGILRYALRVGAKKAEHPSRKTAEFYHGGFKTTLMPLRPLCFKSKILPQRFSNGARVANCAKFYGAEFDLAEFKTLTFASAITERRCEI